MESSLSNLLVVVNEGYGVIRSDSDEGVVEDMPEVIRGTFFARSMEVIVKWHVEKGSLKRSQVTNAGENIGGLLVLGIL